MSETRPMDTTLLFPMIRSAVHSAKCELIDGKRCFVISEPAFLNIMSYFFASGRDFTCDPRIAEEGYENVEVTIGARDKHVYYLAAKMDAHLDKLWDTRGPKEGTK